MKSIQEATVKLIKLALLGTAIIFVVPVVLATPSNPPITLGQAAATPSWSLGCSSLSLRDLEEIKSRRWTDVPNIEGLGNLQSRWTAVLQPPELGSLDLPMLTGQALDAPDDSEIDTDIGAPSELSIDEEPNEGIGSAPAESDGIVVRDAENPFAQETEDGPLPASDVILMKPTFNVAYTNTRLASDSLFSTSSPVGEIFGPNLPYYKGDANRGMKINRYVFRGKALFK